MPRSLPTRPVAVALLAAALGAGGGAATYAALESRDSSTVRQVTVAGSEPAAQSSVGLTVRDIYKRTHKATVEIAVSGQSQTPFGNQPSQGTGSGFVYDSQGHVITNAHVVDNASSVKVTFWNGASYTAKVVGTDSSTDLAVIDVDAPSSVLSPLVLGDSDQVQVGDPVVAIGSPFGLEQSVTSGIVSALHRQMSSPNNFTIDDSIQTDAAINHGNSGGPLINANGRVVGVNSQIESDSGGNDGVGFAIPSNTVRSIASQLIESGKAEHAYLGVSLSGTGEARIGEARPGTPAANAGLRAGDVITEFDGKSVSSSDELQRAISQHAPGEQVAVEYRRDGETKTVEITLASRPN